MNLLRHQQLSVDQYGLTTQEIAEGWQFCEESENGFLCNRNGRSCVCNSLSGKGTGESIRSNFGSNPVRRDRLAGRPIPVWRQHLSVPMQPVQAILPGVQKTDVVQEVL